MSAQRNPDGDSALWRQLLVEAKCVVKRLIAPRAAHRSTRRTRPTSWCRCWASRTRSAWEWVSTSRASTKPHPRVHQWAMCGPSKGSAVLAVDPLLHEIPAKGLGFGTTFARHLADATGRTVLLIPGARGDTSFTPPKNGYTWDPADTRTRVNLYQRAVSAIDTVLSRYPGSEVPVVLWHQGGDRRTADGRIGLPSKA